MLRPGFYATIRQMEKDEFLKLLRISLSGRLPQKGIEESVSFYEDYIDIRLRSGEEKEALFSRLGDPRLIARSILEANNAKGDTSKKPGFLTRLVNRVKAFWNSL